MPTPPTAAKRCRWHVILLMERAICARALDGATTGDAAHPQYSIWPVAMTTARSWSPLTQTDLRGRHVVARALPPRSSIMRC